MGGCGGNDIFCPKTLLGIIKWETFRKRYYAGKGEKSGEQMCFSHLDGAKTGEPSNGLPSSTLKVANDVKEEEKREEEKREEEKREEEKREEEKREEEKREEEKKNVYAHIYMHIYFSVRAGKNGDWGISHYNTHTSGETVPFEKW
ncbi:hypothetical protein POVWA1_002370 [Plasmodium ovale wallikeri]|uniref:Uncharacterized protein n=1 Tax=Plasmodium ovale wallikeri TaxID=864142 RepID=A0A1A8YG95_PLAOA|nr:hypothetical protein POVWA1_002370 [Plasmodium ovale wallikeri]